MARFKLPKTNEQVVLSTVELAKNNYKNWRLLLKKKGENKKDTSVEPFIILNNNLEKFLPYLSTGSIRLYLFYCFKANNATSESWYSVDKIAKELHVTSRSVDNWNAELTTLNLIYRGSANHSSTSTIILPLSNFSIIDHQFDLKNHLSNPQYNEVDGTLEYVFHIFQWRKKNTKAKSFSAPYHLIVHCFTREITDSDGSMIHKISKFFISEDKSLNKVTLDENSEAFKTDNDIFLFKPRIENMTKNVKTKGIALSTHYDLRNELQLNDILTELVESASSLENNSFPTAKLIDK